MEWNHGMECHGMEWNHVKWVFYMRKSNIRTSGIEPESRPWKGGVLPLYYVRVVLFFILFCFVHVSVSVYERVLSLDSSTTSSRDRSSRGSR